MEVTVLGWEKVNARKDVDNPSWFKFKHKFFSDTEFYDFTHAEKVCWLYILCEASKKNCGGKFTLNLLHAHNLAHLSADVVYSAVKKLKALQIIEVSASRRRHAHVTGAGVRQEESREEKKREEERREDESAKPPSAVSAPSPVLLSDSTGQILEGIRREVQDAWIATYQDAAWIKLELGKAWAWILANPQRAPKSNRARFINTWLARGWEQHRKTLPSNAVPIKRDYSFLEGA